jgi:hypothetical protein
VWNGTCSEGTKVVVALKESNESSGKANRAQYNPSRHNLARSHGFAEHTERSGNKNGLIISW